jgi:hypothetical protein
MNCAAFLWIQGHSPGAIKINNNNNHYYFYTHRLYTTAQSKSFLLSGLVETLLNMPKRLESSEVMNVGRET